MSDLASIVQAFLDRPLVVVGDLVADEYLYGTTSRISREAPVLIVRQERRELRPGGAANVVANLRAMGSAPRPVGLVGDDEAGAALLEALSASGVDCAGVLTAADRLTSCKTRVLAGGRNTVRQQMLRIDRLGPRPVDAAHHRALGQRLERALEGAAGLVVSDYGEGVVEGEVFAAVLEQARSARLPVFADSRFRIERFARADTLIPNEPELAAAAGVELDGPETLERAAAWLLRTSACRMLLVKRGRSGMALFRPEQPAAFVPAYGSDEVADVTGAGDTVLAAWSLARVSGADPDQALAIANTAGGIQVTKAGTAVVSAAELQRALAGFERAASPGPQETS